MTRIHWFGVGVVAGVILGWPLAVVFGLAGLISLFFKSKSRLIWSLLLVGSLLGQSRLWQYHQSLSAQNIAPELNKALAVVIAPQDNRDGYGYLTLRLQRPFTGQLRVTITPYEHYLPGDLLTISGASQTPAIIDDGAKSFDYPTYLARFGITKVVKRPQLVKTGTVQRRWLALRWLTGFRQFLERHINLMLPEPEAGFLAGLLLGSRRALSEGTLANLTQTGTIHIIAVSGANVVIVAGICLQLCRLVTGHRWWSFWLTWGVIGGFVVLTGVSAAAVRGGLVASLTLIASHTARGNQKLPLIILPAALTLLANPYFKYDIGWQFSFAAFTGIVLAAPVIQQLLQRWPRCPPLIAQPLVETTSANIFLTPVLIWQLNALSFSSFLINPLVLWLVPLATMAGAGGLLAGFVLPNTLVRLIVWLPLHLILQIIAFGARLPWYVDWSS
ncbi:MAG: ComEC/Rec2 family competence protein [bacterium]|nr:ComEC/Rec2 family competence protein [bacterium]